VSASVSNSPRHPVRLRRLSGLHHDFHDIPEWSQDMGWRCLLRWQWVLLL
jgi:hypothetical protein